jgi:hypothetical protein
MVSLHHELGWVINLQDIIDDLWEGKLVPLTDDSTWPKVIGYIEHGQEVLYAESNRAIV